MKNMVKVFLASLLLATTAQPAARQPAHTGFHTNTQPFYPLANFYEIDGHRDAARYPAAGVHNRTAFAALHIGLAGQPCQTWRSTEHFFQLMKFLQQPDFQALCQAGRTQTPGQVFQMARQRQGIDVLPQWHNIKLYIMYAAVKAKFSQNAALQALLFGTNADWIVEHVLINPHQPQGDNYWGDTNNGHNYLGKILMLVRKELTGEDNYPAAWTPVQQAQMQQAQADVITHQQAWQNAGHPVFVNQQGQQLVVGNEIEDDVADAAQPNNETGNWIKDQCTQHPVRTTAVVVGGVGVCTCAGYAIMQRRNARRARSLKMNEQINNQQD